MFVVVTCNRSNEVMYSRRMGPREVMQAEKFAQMMADERECEIAPANGHIPAGCGDFRVEFRPRKFDDVCIWSGQDFFFA